jgi:hypothetical protein
MPANTAMPVNTAMPLNTANCRSARSKRRSVIGGVTAALVVLALSTVTAPPALRADTAPPSGTPATVSADPLPTVQVDGIVWKQAIHGNTVYATGQFTHARPAGVAIGGAGTVTRQSLIAYDVSTGKLDTHFVHSLTGSSAVGKAIAVSPDGTRLYVGGRFTTVDGQPHANFAAFDLTTNKVMSGFSGTSSWVNAIAATNTAVYIGGLFSTAAGQPRSKLAAYDVSGSLNTGWVANVTGTNVAALAATRSQGNLVVGGSFTKINDTTAYSLGAVRLSDGGTVSPWASHHADFPIRMQPPPGADPAKLGITSLSVNATQVFLSAFTFVPGPHPGSFEGTAAISATDGSLIWVDDCAGDTHDAVPYFDVLYSVSHAHDCNPIGGYPQEEPPQFALAETTYATGVNGPGKGGYYPSFEGMPRGDLLNWFPVLNTGRVTPDRQAAWSVVVNGSYVSLGGEFTTANYRPQQGLVRYANKSRAPNKLGPLPYSGLFNASGYAISPSPADSTGKSLVRVYTTGDPDNATLTYKVYRKDSAVLLASKTIDSRFWKSIRWSFTDTGLHQGYSALYRVVVTDPFGNTMRAADPTIIDDGDPRIAYSSNGSTPDWTVDATRPNSTPDFGRTLHFASRTGAAATYAFNGTSVKVIGEKGPLRGAIRVSVDGGPGVTLSLTSDNRLYQQTIFSKSGLAFGRHTVRLVKASGAYVDIDGIVPR